MPGTRHPDLEAAVGSLDPSLISAGASACAYRSATHSISTSAPLARALTPTVERARSMLTEHLDIRSIEFGEVGHLHQEAGGLHHPIKRGAGSPQHPLHIPKRRDGLLGRRCSHQAPVTVDSHLPGREHEVTHYDRLAVVAAGGGPPGTWMICSSAMMSRLPCTLRLRHAKPKPADPRSKPLTSPAEP